MKKDNAITALRVLLGMVVITQAGVLAFDMRAMSAFARTGFHDFVRLGLAWSEIIAGMLFLIPSTLAFGAWLLLGVFASAMVIHLAHSDFDIGSLLIYSAAVVVVLTHRTSWAQPNREQLFNRE